MQSTAEQSSDAVLLDDSPQCIGIADLLRVGLLVHLDHSDRVTAGVADGTGTKSDKRRSGKLSHCVVVSWQVGTQIVVHKEPGIMTHEGGGRGGDGALEERRKSGCSEFREEFSQTVFSLYLPIQSINMLLLSQSRNSAQN